MLLPYVPHGYAAVVAPRDPGASAFSVFGDSLSPGTALPTWVFEAVVAPLALALAFRHARGALGARRAAGELAALTAYGFALEAVAMAVFASHAYDPSWRMAPLGVPLAVAVVWAAVITSAMAVAGRRENSRGWRAGTAALVAITLDLMIEPVATRASLWRWTPPGPWLDVPVGNFVGWGVIVGAYAYGAARWAGTGPIAIQAVRRIALAAVCILALVLVGAAWRSLGLERRFDDGRGWIAWAAVLIATVWRMVGGQFHPAEVSSWGGNVGAEPWGLASPPDPPTGRHPLRGRRPPESRVAESSRPESGLHESPLAESSLPARLAATPGRGPEAVLCVVGLAFAVEALRIAEPGVTVAAAGSLATIAIIATGLRPPG